MLSLAVPPFQKSRTAPTKVTDIVGNGDLVYAGMDLGFPRRGNQAQ